MKEQILTDDGSLNRFVNVYVNFPGHLYWSTQAYLGAANILKAGGNDGDALLVLVDMLCPIGMHVCMGMRFVPDGFPEAVYCICQTEGNEQPGRKGSPG